MWTGLGCCLQRLATQSSEVSQVSFFLPWKQRVALLEPSVGGLETILAFPGGVPSGGNKPEVKISDTGNGLIRERCGCIYLQMFLYNLALNITNNPASPCSRAITNALQ